MSDAGAEFFIGWRGATTPALRRFLAMVAGTLLAGAGLLALLLGATADDPAGARFALAPGASAPAVPDGEVALEGTLTLAPYPVLHLADGQSILLAEEGKRGAVVAPGLGGQRVAAAGYMVRRGSIGMLVLAGPPTARPGATPLPASQPLGRWRISGEICDGKCAAGAMRPGSGLAHRACASLCLDGALPAVFVAAAPVAGEAFLLLGGPAGGPMPRALRDLIGLRITLEGAVERRGGLLVFLADPASAVVR